MKKNFSLIIALFFPFLVVGAQPPKSTDLMEEGGLQRRDLSIEGSRIVINPYDFDKNPDEITPVVYSNASSLPLNVAYLSTNNSDKGNRFGREVKKLLLLLTDTGEGYSEALTYQTQWMPHALPFSATYPQNVYVEGTDFFYDENTLVRSVRFRSNTRIVLAGSIPGKVDYHKSYLTIEHPDFKYAIASNGLFKGITYYGSYDDLKAKKNRVKDATKAKWWAIEMTTVPDMVWSISFALPEESSGKMLTRVLAPLKKEKALDAYKKQEKYWDTYLSRVPQPVDFSLRSIDAKGVTPEQVKATYYKAWVFLARSVLCPDPAVYPYYQLVAGKPSLWDHGHKSSPFSAAWESFVGMQLYGYINPSISWSALKGMLSLVDDEGMLGGESLPSKKAETAWILYQLTGDVRSLEEVYPALSRYLDWRIKNPRWIYLGMTPENEKDIEFVVAGLIDIKCMVQIADVLGKKVDAGDWENKYQSLFSQCLNWFWDSPQALPVQHLNQFKGRDTFPVQITTGLYLDELSDDYYESMLGLFYKYYDTELPFAGFDAAKYPDMNYTVYGLIEKNKVTLARNLLEANIRDIVLTNSVFAETYRNGKPSGVRPSIFGMASIIDFVLLKNNYFYQKGEPHVVNLFNTTSGVDGLCIRGKKLNVHHNNGETVIVTGDLLNETKEIDVQENEIRTIY